MVSGFPLIIKGGFQIPICFPASTRPQLLGRGPCCHQHVDKALCPPWQVPPHVIDMWPSIVWEGGMSTKQLGMNSGQNLHLIYLHGWGSRLCKLLGPVMSLIDNIWVVPAPTGVLNNYCHREVVMFNSNSNTIIIHDIRLPLNGQMFGQIQHNLRQPEVGAGAQH